MEYEELIRVITKYKVDLGFMQRCVGATVYEYLQNRGFADFDHFKRAFTSDCKRLKIPFMVVWKFYREYRLNELYSGVISDEFGAEFAKHDIEDQLKINILENAKENNLNLKELRVEIKKANDKIIGTEGREIKGLYSDLMNKVKMVRKIKGVEGLRRAKDKLQGVINERGE